MSIQCKIIRNTTPRSGEAQDMATARAVSRGTYDFDQMCNDISEACSLTPADVTAAMESMLMFTRTALLAGQTVELRDFGRFRICIKSRQCTLAETQTREFRIASLVRKYMLRFVPDMRLRRLIAQTARPEQMK